MDSIERIKAALAYIPADDRETWLRMGMAIKDALGNNGFEVWDAWSTGADNYSAADARDVWKSIKPGRGGHWYAVSYCQNARLER